MCFLVLHWHDWKIFSFCIEVGKTEGEDIFSPIVLYIHYQICHFWHWQQCCFFVFYTALGNQACQNIFYFQIAIYFQSILLHLNVWNSTFWKLWAIAIPKEPRGRILVAGISTVDGGREERKVHIWGETFWTSKTSLTCIQHPAWFPSKTLYFHAVLPSGSEVMTLVLDNNNKENYQTAIEMSTGC